MAGFFLEGGYLYIVSEEGQEVLRYNTATDIQDPQVLDLPTDGYEGIAMDPEGDVIYLIGENSDTNGAEFRIDELPVADWDFDSDDEFTDDDITLLIA